MKIHEAVLVGATCAAMVALTTVVFAFNLFVAAVVGLRPEDPRN